MVAETGVEPVSRPNLGLTGYKPAVLPLNYSAGAPIETRTRFYWLEASHNTHILLVLVMVTGFEPVIS